VPEPSSTLVEMLSHFQQLVEREKSALARELHDDLGGCLIGAVMDLSMLVPRIASLGPDAQEKMLRIRRALGEAIELRKACLKAAVKYADDVPAAEPLLDPRSSIALFRCAQEALVLGLERPDVTELGLSGGLDDQALTLRLTGNGGDLSVSPVSITQLMLASLRHRIHAMGGAVRLEPGPSGGIVLTMTVPRAHVAAMQEGSQGPTRP
jgi:two-component system sensor histidine kinase UhpB